MKVLVDAVHLKLKNYSCDQCPFKTAYQSMLKKHTESVHLMLKNYSCDHCDYQATNNGKLKIHINNVHLMKKFCCDQCDYRCGQKVNLMSHIKSRHETTRQNSTRKKSESLKNKNLKECSECDYKTCMSNRLNRHIPTVHLKIKNFTCHVCCKKFSYNSILQQHVNSLHKGVKYNCSQCSFQSSHPGNLKSHVKDVHEKINDLICDHCDLRFSQAGNLKRHVKVRHNEGGRKLSKNKQRTGRMTNSLQDGQNGNQKKLDVEKLAVSSLDSNDKMCTDGQFKKFCLSMAMRMKL